MTGWELRPDFQECLDRSLEGLTQTDMEELLFLLWVEAGSIPQTPVSPADALAETSRTMPPVPAVPAVPVVLGVPGVPEAGTSPALHPRAQGEKLRVEIYEWIRALVAAVVFVGFLTMFFVRIIGVSGNSMKPTLEDGQRLLVSNLFYRPQRGDIIIIAEKDFFDMRSESQPLVKRVIALAGQTVDIDFSSGEVRVDDVVLYEPYIFEDTHLRGDFSYPVTVPPDHLFVMGDNRNDSQDSRFGEVGMVDTRYVLGRVLLRLWPFDRIGALAA